LGCYDEIEIGIPPFWCFDMSDFTEEEVIEMVRRGYGFAGADLSGATSMFKANLSDANLTRAVMNGTILSDANLENTDLRQVIGLATASVTVEPQMVAIIPA
jgi:hypothetical protein